MRFEDYIGQERLLSDLRTAVGCGMVSHAYLFLGPEGVGRRTLAELFARALLCLSESGQPCDSCRSCQLARAGTHPDLSLIEPDGASIRIDQIRALRGRVAQMPILSRRRLFLISSMERLSEAAANALLLTLEDPPSGVVFIGWALAGELLPSTVLSRCQVARLQPLSVEALTQALTARGVDPGQAGIIAAGAGGLPGAARQIAADGSGYASPYEETVRQLFAADPQELFHWAEALAGEEKSRISRHLAGVAEVLGRSVIARVAGESAGPAEAAPPVEALWRLRQAAERAMRYLEANVNTRLVLDALALEFYGERPLAAVGKKGD